MPFRYDLLFGILVPSIIVVAALIYGIVYLIRRQNRKIINDKMAIEREVMQARYTVMPKKYSFDLVAILAKYIVNNLQK
jgi:uncharacterized protein YneF (UPF0154 family)